MIDFATKVLSLPLGKTYLFSTGQAGFIIKSSSGQLLGIDLYLSDSVERIEGNMGYKRMLPKILCSYDLEFNVIVATHPHRDHFDPDAIPELMANRRTQLFASTDCERDVTRLEMSNDHIVYVKSGDYGQRGDFSLYFIECDHGSGAPDAFGVIVKVDDKIIIETGDTSLHLEWRDEYLAHGVPNILIGPINGMFGNMNEQEYAQLSKELKPELTIPCHYGMFAAHGGDPGKFLEEMDKLCPENNCMIMTQGEMMILQ